MLELTSLKSVVTNNQPKKQNPIIANKPYAELTEAPDTIHFSGNALSSKKREKTADYTGKATAVAVKGTGAVAKAAAIGTFAVATAPVTGLNYLLEGDDKPFFHRATQEEQDAYVSDRDVINGLGWG